MIKNSFTACDYYIFFSILACVLFTASVYFISGVTPGVLTNFPDDALFYNIIAHNIYEGVGSTSDGIALSNGYHPLWMVILLILESCISNSLVAEIVLITLINLICLLLLYKLLQYYSNKKTALLFCLIASFEETYFRFLWSGMETHLAWMFLLALLLLLHKLPVEIEKVSKLQKSWMGFFFLLLFFSRLDGGFFWIAYAIYILARNPGGRSSVLKNIKYLFSVFSMPFLVVCVYLFFNQFMFDTALPVSGKIKSITDPSAFLSPTYGFKAFLRFIKLYEVQSVKQLCDVFHLNYTSIFVQVPYLFIIVFSIIFCCILAIRNRIEKGLTVLILYVFLHSLYYIFFQKDTYALSWVKGPEILLMTIIAAYFLFQSIDKFCLMKFKKIVYFGLFIPVVIVAILFHDIRCTNTNKIKDYNVSTTDFLNAVAYIKKEIPDASPIVSYNIGFLGFFSGKKVVSHDGLLNSYAYYLNYKQKKKFLDYWQKHNVCYIANRIPAKAQDPVEALCEQFSGLKPQMVTIMALFHSKDTKAKNKYVIAKINYP